MSSPDWRIRKASQSKTNWTNITARRVNHGRLYPNLDTLVEKGLVDKSKKDDRTNEYSLSNRGKNEITARREWEEEYVGELD